MTIGSYLQDITAVTAITYAYYAWRTKVPLVWTQRAAQKVILSVIQDEIESKPGIKCKIYDLGSGLGGLCFSVARTFPEVEVVGLEMAWPAWIISFLCQKLSRRPNVRFLYRNFWTHNIRDGDIVVCYLGDAVMAQMQEKLCREPQQNRLFITNTFPLPQNWLPIKRIQIEASLSKEILVYRQK